MIEVEMSSDIRKFEPKFVGPFTKRQIICMILSLSTFIPAFILMKYITEDVTNRALVGMAFAAPIILCGWFKMDGCPLEVFAARMIYKYLLTPQVRKYKRKNTYRIYGDKVEKAKLKKMTPKQQKEYLDKKNNTYVRYNQKNPKYKIYS